jgi:hypothetical protein
MWSDIVEVDGRRFAGRFAGFGAPLDVLADPGEGRTVALRPWTYAEHLAALRACVRAGPGGLMLDTWRLAESVLAHSGLDPDEHAWLAPLALWWAGGGDAEEVDDASAADVDLGGGRHAIVREWSEGERLAALARARMPGDEEGDERLDAVGYLDAMVRRSLVTLAPEGSLEALDSRATARLLARVVARNLPDAEADPLLSGALPEAAARATLALCRRLGWTPAQVLAAPAAEVQRLQALLAREAAPRAAPVSARRGLAAHPDAVVFSFAEDDAP